MRLLHIVSRRGFRPISAQPRSRTLRRTSRFDYGTSNDVPLDLSSEPLGLPTRNSLIGLILVVVAGAELFTGNNLIVMATASGKVSLRALLRHWGIVYIGNFVGGAVLVGMVYWFAYLRADKQQRETAG